jgi:uncharacterized damage-inducible protein DinB
MSAKKTMRSLMDYHIWADRQVWECVESITEEQFTQEHDYSTGSIHNQIFHLMFGDWSTVAYMTGGMPDKDDPAYLKQADFPTRESIRRRWNEAEEGLQNYVETLTDEQLQAEMSVPKGDGETFQATLWELLYSHVNHGTNHRAQILALLAQMGAKTVEQGAYFYLMQR